MKCIEDEIPFDIPDGWVWTKINNIAFVTKLAGFEYTKNIAPNLCENGIPLFKGKNVQNSTIIYEFESFIPETVSDELQRSQITKKCILTPYVGTIGNIGIHTRPGKYHLGSNVGKIEIYNDNIILLEEYVVAYLQSGFGYQQLTKHMKATAQASISIEAIRDVYLPIPPANEQLRMQEAISNSLAMIERIENAELDIVQLVQATKSKILDLAIRGKLVPQDPNEESASVLLERIRAEKEELIKQGKIKRDKKESVIFKGDDNSYYHHIENGAEVYDKLIVLPSGWVPCTISDVSYNIGNKENQIKTNEISKKGDFPVVSQSQEYVDGYCDMNEKVINDIPVILFGDHTRVVKYIDFPFVIGADGTKIHKIIRINEKYFYYWMKYTSGMIESKGYSRHYSALKKSCFFLPPLAEQKRIVDAIETLFAQIDKIAEQIS